MGNGGPDDAALPDDHDLRALVELRHYYSSPSKNSVPPRLTGLPVRRRPSGLAQTGAGAAGPSRRGAILSEAAARAPRFRDGLCRISDTRRHPPAGSRKPAESLVPRGGLAGLPAVGRASWWEPECQDGEYSGVGGS